MSDITQDPLWSIGTLAKHTQVSIRALRHYHKIGLLLGEIKTIMQNKIASLSHVAQWQIDRLQQSLQQQSKLCDLLESTVKQLDQHKILLT